MEKMPVERRTDGLAAASLLIPSLTFVTGIPVERLAPYPMYPVFSAVWMVLLPVGGLLGALLGFRALRRGTQDTSGRLMAAVGMVWGIFQFLFGLGLIWVVTSIDGAR